jgi:hypothetical protein
MVYIFTRSSKHNFFAWRLSEANEPQMSYSVEQADIFQYQSYSHSDDMLIILKSNINTIYGPSIVYDICIFAGKITLFKICIRTN